MDPCDSGWSCGFRSMPMAALMVLVVSGVGVLVFAYTGNYLSRGAPDVGRLVGLLALFAGAMLGLVLADNLLVLYTCWELTSVTSYLLIGNDHADARARAAALQALLVTSAGGLAMLGGFVLLGQAAGTYRLSAILAAPPSGTAGRPWRSCSCCSARSPSRPSTRSTPGCPGAMVAPTPVSAYLHSATMVKAGVYLVPGSPRPSPPVPLWRPTVRRRRAWSTMVAGGLRALRQHDLKLLLAFGTVSQLGFLFVLFGVGTAGGRDGRLRAAARPRPVQGRRCSWSSASSTTRPAPATCGPLPGLGRGLAAGRRGSVVVSGRVDGRRPAGARLRAKEAALRRARRTASRSAASAWCSPAWSAGSVLTVAYSVRFVWGAFTAGADRLGRRPAAASTPRPRPRRPRSSRRPRCWPRRHARPRRGARRSPTALVSGAAAALDRRPRRVAPRLWHGFNLPLVLSAVALAGGAAAVPRPARPVARVLARRPPAAERRATPTSASCAA